MTTSFVNGSVVVRLLTYPRILRLKKEAAHTYTNKDTLPQNTYVELIPEKKL